MRKIVHTSQHFSSASSKTSSLKTNQVPQILKIICFLQGTRATPDFVELKVPRKILNSPDRAAAVDRHKLSPNAFNNVFASIVSASGGDVNDFVLSTSTSSRTIKKVRTEMFDRVKTDFKELVKNEFVSIYWDEKLIQKEILLHLRILQFFQVITRGQNCWELPL